MFNEFILAVVLQSVYLQLSFICCKCEPNNSLVAVLSHVLHPTVCIKEAYFVTCGKSTYIVAYKVATRCVYLLAMNSEYYLSACSPVFTEATGCEGSHTVHVFTYTYITFWC